MKVGDTVTKIISTSVSSSKFGVPYPEEQEQHTGKVIYVHPKGRFYLVEFELPFGTIRECYREGEDD